MLDSFRGLCAISIVLFHTKLKNSITELPFFKGSSTFVEFFFVLSGFVLAHKYAHRRDLKFTDFMVSRLFRLYPLHFFMFTVMFSIEAVKFIAYKFGGYVFSNLPFTKGFSLQEIIPNLLLLQSWTHFTDPQSYNYPSWSISVEFYMYALFFSLSLHFQSRKVLIWVALSIAGFFLININFTIFTSEVLRGVSCFFGGVFTYWAFSRNAGKLKINKPLGTFLEITLISIVIFSVNSDLKHEHSLAISVLFMTTVFWFALEIGVVSDILRFNVFRFMGRISYSIYMTHAAVLSVVLALAIIAQKITGRTFAPMIDGERYIDFGGSIINNLAVLILVVMVIGASLVTYRFIEIYGQKKYSKYILRKPEVTLNKALADFESIKNTNKKSDE